MFCFLKNLFFKDKLEEELRRSYLQAKNKDLEISSDFVNGYQIAKDVILFNLKDKKIIEIPFNLKNQIWKDYMKKYRLKDKSCVVYLNLVLQDDFQYNLEITPKQLEFGYGLNIPITILHENKMNLNKVNPTLDELVNQVEKDFFDFLESDFYKISLENEVLTIKRNF